MNGHCCHQHRQLTPGEIEIGIHAGIHNCCHPHHHGFPWRWWQRCVLKRRWTVGVDYALGSDLTVAVFGYMDRKGVYHIVRHEEKK